MKIKIDWITLIVIVSCKRVEAQFSDCDGAVEGGTIQFLYPRPASGILTEITWYNLGISNPDQRILFHDETVPDTFFFNGYDDTKAEVLITDKNVGLHLFNSSSSDLSNYQVIVTQGLDYDEYFTITFLIEANTFNDVQLDACGDPNTPGQAQITVNNCNNFSVVMPNGYSHNFTTEFQNDDEKTSTTHSGCMGVPCVISHQFNTLDTTAQVNVSVDFHLCQEVPWQNFLLTFPGGNVSILLYVILQPILEVADTVAVTLAVLFCIIQGKCSACDEHKKRDMWLILVIGVCTIFVIAGATLGAYYNLENRDAGDDPLVLGINMGFAVGCVAIIIIFGVVMHLKLKKD